ALLMAIGCGSHRDHQAALPAPAPAPSAKSQPAPPLPPTAASAVGPRAGGIAWDVTPPLVQHEPKSPVRTAEYWVQGEPGTELVVFHFGEEKVSIDAQIQSWLVQVEQPDSSDTAQKAKRGELKVGPLTVSTVEVSGMYTGPVTMPGVQLAPSERDWTL